MIYCVEELIVFIKFTLQVPDVCFYLNVYVDSTVPQCPVQSLQRVLGKSQSLLGLDATLLLLHPLGLCLGFLLGDLLERYDNKRGRGQMRRTIINNQVRLNDAQ